MPLLDALPSAIVHGEALKKRGRVEGDAGMSIDHTDKDTKKLLLLLCKLALNSAQQIRCLRSIVLSCYAVPTESEIVKGISRSMQAYDALKDKYSSKEEKIEAIGPHHIHAWDSLLRGIETKLNVNKELMGMIAKYEETTKEIAAKEKMQIHKVLQREVKYCRIMNTFNKRVTRRLEVSFAEGSNSQQMWNCIEPHFLNMPDHKKLPGIAPPGDMERRIQAALEESSDP
eukprot:TRINITY_DN41558_c0_g1_i1.p3 TRINITY_DN41558_c0_g1~~TRINITY_DN41558_c0_g1_i1.p3  ORF type:complete len:229 (+),score=74.86 TRINITY_DN41558_c0_g1_i1:841-1527(+)